MLLFISGMLVGSFVGVVIMSLMVAAGKGDKHLEMTEQSTT